MSDTICVELTISKNRWCILFACRPPLNNNLKTFFEEINLSLSTTVNEYDNIMLIGDVNLNTKTKNNTYYSQFCDAFDLTNLIKANTCLKSSNQPSIDVILTNRSRSFKKSEIITTGLSDRHKMILNFCRSYYSRFQIQDYFSKLRTKECNQGVKYDNLSNIFRSSLDTHQSQDGALCDNS